MQKVNKQIAHSTILFLTVILLLSCSRKNDKFLNRKFHATTTKYNVLYNGNNAFESGKEGLITSFQDDYWSILPIERLQITDEINLTGKSKNTDFQRAEEKAVKAIQKHGMYIKGREKNPQTAEAYLLLGKSRYFDQRFVPALEAFNYILYKYPNSTIINQAKIWREKVNVRLENTELAIKNLKRLIEKEQLSDQNKSDAYAMLTQAYLDNKHRDSALTTIKIAATYAKNKAVKGRLHFIKAQLYHDLEKQDSAALAYDEIIALKRKTLWVYYINARLAKARYFNTETGDHETHLEALYKLTKNIENKSYLDKIHHTIAEYYSAIEKDSLAKTQFNASIVFASKDTYLKSKNYRALAAYSFEERQYKSAEAYYDSTLVNLKKNSKEFRLFKKKKDNLKDVITYEDIATRNDSILQLLSLSEKERIAYFETHIATLKAVEKAKKEKAEALEQTNENLAAGGFASENISAAAGMFYFYNPTTVAYGKESFRKQWGERALEDNWRRKNKSIVSIEEEDFEELPVEEKELLAINDKHTVDFYLNKLPVTAQEKDSITNKRNKAYYQLGLIYKQKFKEYDLAIDRLGKLLSFEPKEQLVLPTKYQLYKTYILQGSDKAIALKQDIIKTYPESRYAEILKNPQANLADKEGASLILYKDIYQKFEDNEFELADRQLADVLPKLEGDEMLPKFEWLKAVVLGKMDGVSAYKKQLNYIALSYPNSEEGKAAAAFMKKGISKLEHLKLVDNTKGKRFKLVIAFPRNDNNTQEFKETLDDYLNTSSQNYLTTSEDYYNRTHKFIVVHGFITSELVALFHEELSKKIKTTPEEYEAVSSENYKVIQLHKKWAAFKNRIKN